MTVFCSVNSALWSQLNLLIIIMMSELNTNLNPVRSLVVLFNLKHIPFFSSPSCCCSGSVLSQGYCGCSVLVSLILVSSSSTLSWFCFIPLFLKECLPWQHCVLNDLKSSFDCSSLALLALTVDRSVPPCPCLLTLTAVPAVRGPAPAELTYFLPTYLKTCWTAKQLLFTLNNLDIT